jgi:hypothetical protein
MQEFWVWFETGLAHIADINGYDHILFLWVLCIPFSWQHKMPLLWLVSSFTLGHSLSLAIAVMGWFKPNVALIEFLIPLSIFITAIQNIIAVYKQNPLSLQTNYALTLCFGFIHGLGFSFLLRSLLGETNSIAMPLLAFNLGLELGQIFIIIALLILTTSLKLMAPKKEVLQKQLLSILGAILSLWLMAERFSAII